MGCLIPQPVLSTDFFFMRLGQFFTCQMCHKLGEAQLKHSEFFSVRSDVCGTDESKAICSIILTHSVFVLHRKRAVNTAKHCVLTHGVVHWIPSTN